MDQSLKPDEVQYIQEFIETLHSTLDDLVGRYKTFNQDTSCEDALKELNILDNQVSELNEKIKGLCDVEFDVKSIDRDQEHLMNLKEEIAKVIQGLKVLQQNVDTLNSVSESILPEHSNDDSLEITEIKNKIVNGEMKWFVSIKSKESNAGYFRNVEIRQKADDSIVGKIQLIQPGTEVTIKCSEINDDSPYLIVRDQNGKDYSEFQYFPLKILSICCRPDSTLEVQIKNLTDKNFENCFIISARTAISQSFSVPPRGTRSIQAICQLSEVNCVVWNAAEEKYDSLVFPFYQNFNYSSIVDDLTEDQKKLFDEYLETHPNYSLLAIKNHILNP